MSDNSIYNKLIAGGVSCSIMSAILNPMDLTKVRLQTQHVKTLDFFKSFISCTKGIIEKEGITTLWTRGLAPSMLRESTYSSIRLGLYDPIRDYLMKNKEGSIPLYIKILSGFLSGGIGSVLVTPTDVIKIRFQASFEGLPYKNTFEAFKIIYKEEGIKNGLYKGVGITTLRASILTSAQLSSYDHSKYLILKSGLMNDSFPLHFLSAAISGLITTIFTSPVDVIKTRIMNDHLGGEYKNSWDCFIQTIKKDGGFKALYKGFIPNYFRLGPHFIFSLPLYEYFRKHLGVGHL